MNGEVKTKELDKGGGLAKAKEVGKIPRIVLVSINRGEFAEPINIAVDAGSKVG